MPSIGRVVLPFGTQGSHSVNESIKETMDSNCNPVLHTTDNSEDSDNDFRAPDSQLIDRVVAQVEFYFSDENLIKDEFILKHIRRNKDGFISLKLLSSFRKVKVITKNCKLVAHCVKVGSKKLELNDTETKIRRKTPLPALEGDKHSRTIIAYNIPMGTDNIDSISKEFSPFGDIALIRILKSGSPASSSVIAINQLKAIANKCDLNKTSVATIEYNNKSDAEEALKRMQQKSSNDWRKGIEVMAMKNTSQVHDRNPLKNNETENSNQRKSYEKQTNFKRPLIQRQKSKSYSSGDERKFLENVFKKPVVVKKDDTNRMQTINCLRLPANVVRMPRGPDGTNGFTANRNHRSNSGP